MTVSVNYPPVADAGPDQFLIQPGALVTLDGGASYDPEASPMTFQWTQTTGPAIALSTPTATATTFTPAVCGDYTFQLVVNDGLADSTPDFVFIDVNCIPVADAGTDMTYASGFPKMTGWTITLDGSASADADGDPLSYSWTQIAGPAPITLSSSTAAQPTFIGAMSGYYTFRLIVNDSHIDSPADTVDLELEAGPNPPAPVSLTNAVQGQLDLAWTAPTTRTDGTPLINPGLAGYFVLRATTPGGPYTQIGCSSDLFAIRPQSLTITALDQNWQSAGTARALANIGASGGNVHKASTSGTPLPFTLRATPVPAGATNYNGTPTTVA